VLKEGAMTDDDLTTAARKLRADAPALAAVLALLPINSHESVLTLDDLAKLAERLAHRTTRSDLWRGLQQMEVLGFGSSWVGRRGQPTRIDLNDGLTVGRVARAFRRDPGLGDPAEATPAVALTRAGRLPPTVAEPEMNTYRFPLRPGVMAELVLPVDLSAAEVERLNLFLKSLVAT
jgi:hypothetical protein